MDRQNSELVREMLRGKVEHKQAIRKLRNVISPYSKMD